MNGDYDSGETLAAETIGDLVRAKIDSGEWKAFDALVGLQTVLTIVALGLGVPRDVFLEAVAHGYDHAIRQ